MARFNLTVTEKGSTDNLDDMGKVDPLITTALFYSKVIAELESYKLKFVKLLDERVKE